MRQAAELSVFLMDVNVYNSLIIRSFLSKQRLAGLWVKYC
jgi:hypothetical protein